jgi:uncharacterized protein
VRKEIAFMGIGRPNSYSRLLVRTVKPNEVRAIEDDLVESGELTPVAVSGWRGRQFVVTSDLALLDEVGRGEVPAAWTPVATTSEEEVALLSPLDPVTARGRAKPLFDFEYVWEIYKKPELVQYGRYTMPILWGDRLVGRLDPKMDRATRSLFINGVWFEHDALVRDTSLRHALRAGGDLRPSSTRRASTDRRSRTRRSGARSMSAFVVHKHCAQIIRNRHFCRLE